MRSAPRPLHCEQSPSLARRSKVAFRRLHEAAAHGAYGGLDAILDLQLDQNARDVILDRVRTQEQRRGGGFRDQALNEGSAAALIDRRLVGASNGSRLWGQIKEKVVWA